MDLQRKVQHGILVFVIALALAAPANASRFIRVGLDTLVAANGTIVVGEALESHSYWNEARNFILTDVKIAVSDVLKGSAAPKEMTVTLAGGTVGDLTTTIVGGAELVPGKSYLLFLKKGTLLGAKDVFAVPDQRQGVYEIRMDKAKKSLRAVSQAHGEALVPDVSGAEPPGGAEGLQFDELVRSVRDLVARGNHKEVTK